MNSYTLRLPKTLWLGSIGLAAMLLGWTPFGKAQEVNPALFTATGVEDAYPVKKLAPKKTAKLQVANHPTPALSNQAVARKRTRPAARKQNAIAASSF